MTSPRFDNCPWDGRPSAGTAVCDRNGHGVPAAPAGAETPVLVIGPPPFEIGGMAGVVAQMLALNFAGRYQLVLCPTTSSAGRPERLTQRITRHGRQLRLLDEVIRRVDARLVHIHTCSGFSFYRSVADLWVARRRGCRVILHVHGAAFDAFCVREPAWRRRIIESSLAEADRVVALSKRWGATLHRASPGARVVVVENAVEIPDLPRRPPEPGPCRFVFLARMDQWKGVDDLLQACAVLRRQGIALTLSLAGPPGTAGDAPTLREKIRSLNLERIVRYVGPVRDRRKANLLAGADAYVQPSHHEGMPLSMLEALAYRLPVVATRVGAVPEVITHERHGLLVPPRAFDQLAAAMREMALNVANRGRMSEAARALAVERFSLARFREDLRALYDVVK